MLLSLRQSAAGCVVGVRAPPLWLTARVIGHRAARRAASMLTLFVLMGVTACGSSTQGIGGSDHPFASTGGPICGSLLADPHLEGEGEAVGEFLSGEVMGCSVDFPSQGAALAFLRISASCAATVLVAFDREEDGVTWILDREETAQLNEATCGFRQAEDAVVLTSR
jgi:hypothetical protein